MRWAILCADKVLTREDILLSELGDLEYWLFLVYDEEGVYFAYAPRKERAIVRTNLGVKVVDITGHPFFHWKNKVTVSSGEVGESKTLTFGLKDKLEFIQTDQGFEIHAY